MLICEYVGVEIKRHIICNICMKYWNHERSHVFNCVLTDDFTTGGGGCGKLPLVGIRIQRYIKDCGQ